MLQAIAWLLHALFIHQVTVKAWRLLQQLLLKHDRRRLRRTREGEASVRCGPLRVRVKWKSRDDQN